MTRCMSSKWYSSGSSREFVLKENRDSVMKDNPKDDGALDECVHPLNYNRSIINAAVLMVAWSIIAQLCFHFDNLFIQRPVVNLTLESWNESINSTVVFSAVGAIQPAHIAYPELHCNKKWIVGAHCQREWWSLGLGKEEEAPSKMKVTALLPSDSDSNIKVYKRGRRRRRRRTKHHPAKGGGEFLDNDFRSERASGGDQGISCYYHHHHHHFATLRNEGQQHVPSLSFFYSFYIFKRLLTVCTASSCTISICLTGMIPICPNWKGKQRIIQQLLPFSSFRWLQYTSQLFAVLFSHLSVAFIVPSVV